MVFKESSVLKKHGTCYLVTPISSKEKPSASNHSLLTQSIKNQWGTSKHTTFCIHGYNTILHKDISFEPMLENLGMNFPTSFERGQAATGFEHLRESEPIRAYTFLLHSIIQFESTTLQFMPRIPFNDCVP
eukprot:TRINITY_DN4387_c0_g2_i1.p1 TRINITY_DN4387_c0_g2~~TRINITY_DN4387_c0_g2_i1.p1  ORF type:complete len:131 (-),score=8.93 TRINITY_DN4387_c0_g2_i1:612-1004(-)